MAKRNVKVVDKDHGFRQLASSLGEMGHITLGVQGEEANKPHPNANMTIGDLAATHEMGLNGQKERSWCRAWMDENAARMLRESAEQFKAVMARTITRNAALITLGYDWTKAMQERMDAGLVRPPISASTAARKGHAKPLIETYALRNTVSYKIWLPQFKSIRDTAQRTAARGKK